MQHPFFVLLGVRDYEWKNAGDEIVRLVCVALQAPAVMVISQLENQHRQRD